MFDFSQLPLSGSFVLSCALYTGVSIVAGQVIAARTIERSGWEEFCETTVRGDLRAQIQPEPVVPNTRCDALIGWVHGDVNRLCNQFGNPDLAGPGARAAREAERLIREQKNARLRRAAEGAGSLCACAGRVYARETIMGWGLYAGSARLISTPRVAGMNIGLNEALSSPFCAGMSEVLP